MTKHERDLLRVLCFSLQSIASDLHEMRSDLHELTRQTASNKYSGAATLKTALFDMHNDLQRIADSIAPEHARRMRAEADETPGDD